MAALVLVLLLALPVSFYAGAVCGAIAVLRAPLSTVLEWHRRYGRREKVSDVIFVHEDR